MNTINTTTLNSYERGRFSRIAIKHKTNEEAAKAFGLTVSDYLRFKNLGRANIKTISSIRKRMEAEKTY